MKYLRKSIKDVIRDIETNSDEEHRFQRRLWR
jgi:hypothetical protein